MANATRKEAERKANMTSSKETKNQNKIEVKKIEPIQKVVQIKKPEVKKVEVPSEPDLSDEDVSALMTQAIEEKKQAKFAKMIDRGSAIAAESQD